MKSAAGNEENIQYFRPELSCQLHYWGSSTHSGASTPSGPVTFIKTKLMKTHPLLPLILTCDEEDNISLWNYELKQRLMSQPVYSLLVEAENRSTPVTAPRKRLMQRSINRYNDELLFQYKAIEFAPKTANSPPAKYREIYGHVKEIEFIDESSIAYNGGGELTFSSSTQATEYRICVQFDQAVAFLHLMSKNASVITQQQLGKLPTAYEFISPHYCLLGSADGVVRVWKTTLSKIEKTFSAGKSEVTTLKVLPFER